MGFPYPLLPSSLPFPSPARPLPAPSPVIQLGGLRWCCKLPNPKAHTANAFCVYWMDGYVTLRLANAYVALPSFRFYEDPCFRTLDEHLELQFWYTFDRFIYVWSCFNLKRVFPPWAPAGRCKGYTCTPEFSLQKYSTFSNFRFLPARRYVSAVFATATCLSVCPSVCHMPVLCLAERKQDREMYTIW